MRRAFQILFSAKYWRMLKRNSIWRSVLVSMRRLHKDKRAWKQLFAILLLLSLPFLCLFYVAWVMASAGGVIGLGIMLIVVGVGGLRKRYVESKRGDVQTLKLSDARKRREATPAFRREVANLALLHALLVDRAGSEGFLCTKVLPERIEIITRRRHLEILRKFNLYERLGDIERDLLLLPDGHWDDETIRNVELAIEPLRVLRWLLRIDDFLPNIGASLLLDYGMARSIAADPETLFKGKRFVGMDDIEVGHDAAGSYLSRCFAEGLDRRLYEEKDEDQVRWAGEVVRELGGRESVDLLLGTSIVSNAPDQVVKRAALLALRRSELFDWVKQRINGEREEAPELQVFFLR
jgi:hypothetical protein